MSTYEIDDSVRALLGGHDDPGSAERGSALAAQRLEEALAGDATRGRRRRRMTTRAGVAIAFVVIATGGAAIAAGTDLADRVLGSRDPAAERVEAVREDPRPTLTQEQLIVQFRSSFIANAIGGELTGELSPPLVADAKNRVSARRTAEGSVCMQLFERSPAASNRPAMWGMSGASCGIFQDGWPLMEAIGSSGGNGRRAYGLFADGVAQVRFLIDGETHDATMGRGAFLWQYPDERRPSDIEVVLDDGTVVRKDLTWLYNRRPPYRPSTPRVIE